MIVSKLNEGYDIVYTDEDKTDENLNRYFSVYRKPDFNLNLFLSNNYMCHFTVISKRSLQKPEISEVNMTVHRIMICFKMY